MTAHYSSEEFETKYTYFGPDLGASWSKERTVFRVWAPTARSVKVNLYHSGDPGNRDRFAQLEMEQSVAGTWTAEARGDLNGVYYTYLVDLGDRIHEACDPYARTTGVNGQRAMVIDLRSTDPDGWDRDRNPHAGERITDAVLYELHIRDLSSDPSSGITHKGKFLGVAERGTTSPDGAPTGLDHIVNLGVTHLHLLPVYDYATVDERHPEWKQFNWGYDPMNFNVPEGSYATDPYHGEVRVREMKQMVKALHDAGISVVMDVVYNHVYDGGSFCFNRIVPDYFCRVHDGYWTNGSGCGNDTASERSMVHKYIVDSVKYWADEYHIDGFRFDLVGLLDVWTVNDIIATVRQSHPDVIFYGEGWYLDTWPTKPDVTLAVQHNAWQTPRFAYFNDTFRDLLRGSVFDNDAAGYVSGAWGLEDTLSACFQGTVHWCPGPSQTVNYASCHDNMALFDRLCQSTRGCRKMDRIRMNKLAAAIVMTAQGIPFLQAGEEMLRTKVWPDGHFDSNSYASPDFVNSLKWGSLSKSEYRATTSYYQGLIAFRKAHSTLRLATAEEVWEHVRRVDWDLPRNVTAFHLRGAKDDPAQGIFIIFNPNREEVTIPLPPGKWGICVNARRAGVKPVAKVEGSVAVAPISAMVLTLDPPGRRRKTTTK